MGQTGTAPEEIFGFWSCPKWNSRGLKLVFDLLVVYCVVLAAEGLHCLRQAAPAASSEGLWRACALGSQSLPERR